MNAKSPRGAERRTEARLPAAGEEVRLRQSGVLTGSFPGRLLDLAPHGFRARHACLLLRSGELVDFEFRGRKGLATTIWTRIVGAEAETGFRILNDGNP